MILQELAIALRVGRQALGNCVCKRGGFGHATWLDASAASLSIGARRVSNSSQDDVRVAGHSWSELHVLRRTLWGAVQPHQGLPVSDLAQA